jgi:hypothetical protein
MAANFPKLPGFVPTHDPTKVDHKKVSHKKLEDIRNGKNVHVPLYEVPRLPTPQGGAGTFAEARRGLAGQKPEENKSYSQTIFKNHFNGGKDIAEQFEPTFVKLDKQVRPLLLNCYFIYYRYCDFTGTSRRRWWRASWRTTACGRWKSCTTWRTTR